MARGKKITLIAAGTVLVLGAGAGVLAWQPWAAGPATAIGEGTAKTVSVSRESLASNIVLNTQLGYGEPGVLGGTGGILTELPAVGSTVRVGENIYERDGVAIPLLRGSRPYWRELSIDSTPGKDIAQLEQSLVDLGFGGKITVDEKFTAATEQALKAWQKSRGIATPTGVFSPQDAVVVNADSIRIAEVKATLGDEASGPVLTYTSPLIRGTASLTAAQSTSLAVGTTVTATLPGGGSLAGVISRIDTDPGSTAEGEKLPPRAVIDFADQEALAGIGLPAVRVSVAGEGAENALVVPVVALLALAEGGYGVEVVRGDTTRIVPVRIGLVADARVQLLGDDIAEGDEVVVPS
ncbi:peptidoglycan-binding protein [Mycetocola spongiae]|uniref:peptidoglycan-binding protein n=1 Tax=Mycetocola spongiae TaxID=2859226 RepID=UPI001CF32F11|nr:peptidoglycan-binding protein [Mycetocola spongiae]UCR87877.1 peptidoglycan-binding protein [Mycetocola spongiae]